MYALADDKAVDQLRLITIVVYCPDSFIASISISKFASLLQAAAARKAVSRHTWSINPTTTDFLTTGL